MQPLRCRGAVAAAAVLLALAAVPRAEASSIRASTVADALAHRSELSPVTRVVELLKSLTAKVEQEGKAEEDLYETFVCWATSMIGQKEKSNTAAQTRADTLKTYMDDLQAGRIELTTERADLEKEIEALSSDIEAATQMRQKEAADYEDAQAEMQKAIDALTAALEVLRTATEDHKKGVLLSTSGRLGEGFAARAKEAAALSQAMELGDKVLTKGDSVFLRRLLTGEPPDRASWKELNREATFKMDYKARSFKIQAVLSKLLENFSSDLAEATKKEQDSASLYGKLMDSKGSEKTAAQDALAKMEKENGARGLSMDEAREERQALLTQISDDEGYISDVRQALATKKTEWKTRQELRTGELAAISKAIEILHSDDARDLFKRSFASQGYSFLQESSASSSSQRGRSAMETLQAAARAAGDSRLAALALRVTSRGHFDEVIKAIDTMLQLLAGEEAEDLQKKEACEADRANDTRTAIKTSREMDELTEAVTALRSKIEELSAEISEKEERIVAINGTLQEAAEMRAKENAEYLVAKKDDQDAAALVANAKTVISDFYSQNGLALAQQRGSAQQPFVSEAGKAPPPPPPTWKAPYGGATDETTGIVAVLGMIHEDILADVAKADDEEQAAEALYQKTKTDLEDERTGLQTSISNLEITKGEAIQSVQDNLRDRGTKAEQLGVVMKKIADAEPGCDFFAINFGVRSRNRQIEIDGLQKAKAILSGGTFDALPDPNRELKPGDAAALVQGHLRAGHRPAVTQGRLSA